MSSFLYFVPHNSVHNRQIITAADFKALGLEHALTEGNPACMNLTQGGPSGSGGMVCVPNHERASNCRYAPAEQLWRQGPGGKYWVGVDSNALPTAEDLIRPRYYDGQTVRLRNGEDWIVPRCWGLLQDRGSTLPVVFDLADDGQSFIGRPDARFSVLCKRVEEFGLAYFGSKPRDYLFVELLELAIAGLAVNYRVGVVEAVSMLSLFGTDETEAVVRALIDADAIVAHEASLQREKKAGAAPAVSGPDTNSGLPAATTAIPQASPPTTGS